MKRWSVVLFAVGLPGCMTNPSPQSPDVFAQLVGKWDEVHAESCKNPHVLSFDGDKTTMLIEYAELGWASENDSRKIFRYEILDVGPATLRARLENEPRMDEEGKPVVWHIVVVDAETYCWGRDDWPQGACTPPRKRCGTDGRQL